MTVVERTGTIELTLPALWYHSPQLYELERRAIFAKKWLQITHKSHFINVGDYAKYEMAGYPFFIIKNKEGLAAFHNVCRHRAFPVIQKDEGNANVIACGYHGWSYGLGGNLAKAPRFDVVEDFRKEEYSLFPIHLHIDTCGFVWINLQATTQPTLSWEVQCLGADTQERLKDFAMDEYVYDHSWKMDGPFNWKTLIDNYNECYHCSVAHPGIAATTDLPNYAVETKSTFIAHFARPKPEFATANNSNVAPTFVFPSSSATINTVYLYLMRVVPTGPTSVSMEYEVYRHASCTDDEFAEMDVFMKQIENEDRELCTAAQRNLNAGIYEAGPLHPHNEKGVRYFKGLVKEAILAHRAEEENLGREIWPAARIVSGKETADEEAFCRSLCNGNGDSKLAW